MDAKKNKSSEDDQSTEIQSSPKKEPNTLFWVIFLIITVVVADVASKFWIITHLSFHDVWPITDFFNLVLTINHGVSFSMFTAHHMYGVYALIGLTSMLTFVVLYFIFTSQTLFEKLAFSLIFSGAIGNLFDRIRIQGVVDFLDFHIAGYHWPAFNVADTAICIGVGLLFIYYFLLQKKKEQ